MEIGESRKLGGLLKTGQTTQYGGYPDDGYYEKGLSKRYVVLTAGRYSGTTSITLYNKTDLISNNCVHDRRTRLMWSRYLTDGLGTDSDGKLPWTTDVNGQGIFAYVAAANVAKLGGYTDWRIPNDMELASLRDMEATTGAPNATAFPGWPTADYVCSSTTRPDDTTYAYGVMFVSGRVSYAAKTTTCFVSLVRGGRY